MFLVEEKSGLPRYCQRFTDTFFRQHNRYNGPTMSLIEQIQKDITAAMKAREEQRLSTLRMVKSALKNKVIDKMAPLDDK